MADRIADFIGAVLWAWLWLACVLVCLVFLPLDLLNPDRQHENR